LFLVGMAAGGAAASVFGANAIGGVEQMVAASVVVLGLMLVVARRVPAWVAGATVPLFAAFHGLAHVAEAPGGVVAYGAGMLAATATLLAIGFAAGKLVSRARLSAEPVWRLAGVATAVLGVVLLTRVV
ncbi:MAG TPA: HupE/UreJ family protein, partial [Humisphaera sp.]